jgi:hypothetical protein
MQKRVIIMATVTIMAILSMACSNAEQGQVLVKTKWGKAVEVHQPGSWITTWAPGESSVTVDTKPWTNDVGVHTSTSDNARLKITVKVNAELNRSSDIDGQVQTVARDAIKLHAAYDIYKQQDTVQKAMEERLKPFFEKEMFSTLVSVQIVGSPDFDNDAIETAASNVVAAQKQKEAEQQYKEAAEIKLQKEQIENQIYTQSPQAFVIRKMYIERDIAAAWASHQGTLVINGANMQVQVPAR